MVERCHRSPTKSQSDNDNNHDNNDENTDETKPRSQAIFAKLYSWKDSEYVKKQFRIHNSNNKNL